MIRLYIFIVLALGVYIFIHSRWFRSFKQVWCDKGFPSKKKKLTMFDVRRLLIKGEKDLAIRVYCELFKADSQEARKAVDEIERSIQPKNFES